MATEVSRRKVKLQDMQNFEVTLVTYDDGSIGLLSSNIAGGAGGTVEIGATSLAALETIQVGSLPQPTSIGVAGTGELAGSATAVQMPTLACKYVRYKARLTNAGNVYIGLAGVTKPDAATDATTGFSLTPGDDSGWIPITNTNLLYRISDNVADCLTFIALV